MTYPDWNQGPLCWPATFFYKLTINKHKKNSMREWLLLLAAVLAGWWHSVASSEALDLLYWTMHAVLYRRIAMAIKMASKVGVCFCSCFVCCFPGRRWGDTEQVVARWRRPVASGVALNMPHWAMPSVLLQRICMAIKMAYYGGAFVFCCRLFCLM